jgi:hypothetical protein
MSRNTIVVLDKIVLKHLYYTKLKLNLKNVYLLEYILTKGCIR